MKNFKNSINELLENQLFEMANLSKDQTGIDGVVIWISSQGDNQKSQHRPRIKVTLGKKFDRNNNNVYSISDNPELKVENIKISSKDEISIKEFIRINKEALLKYWNGDLYTVDCFKELKKIIK